MKIGIIGHFGGNETFNDGQTIKTISLFDALAARVNDPSKIKKIDTYYLKRKPFNFLCNFLTGMFQNQVFIVLLSFNGRKYLFPILYFFAKVMKKRIYHYGIGGCFADEIKKSPHLKKYYNSFRGNWVESRLLEKMMQDVGVNNAEYMPNFKRISILKETELHMKYSEPYRFCIFSRINKEKGVEDAINAITQINKTAGKTIAVLDLYGPIRESYQIEFEQLVEKHADYCRYKGVIDATKSVSVLKDYYMLLFPTQYETEGVPGTIIDALSAGVPVIARRWRYCDEMLEDEKTGYVYDFDKPEQLVLKIQYAIMNQEKTINMKKNCLKKAEEYSEDVVINKILQHIRDENN